LEQHISKEHTQRLFVAIPVPEPISRKLEDWTRAHKEKLPFRKWTHPLDYHITLQFLGDTPAAKQEALQAVLKEARVTPFSLALNGAGTFGPKASPRVLWAAVSGDLEGLTALHQKVINSTRSIGFEPEDRPYAPHITLARKFAGGGEMPNEAILSAPSLFEWEADRFVLMRTHMNASPMYEVIGAFPLS
jgi:2'-5' RNA ligase